MIADPKPDTPDVVEMLRHPLCGRCGWARGGVDSWNGRSCKCGHVEPPISRVEERS